MIYGEIAQFKDMAYDSFNEALPTGKHPIYTEIAQYISAAVHNCFTEMRIIWYAELRKMQILRNWGQGFGEMKAQNAQKNLIA